MNRGPDGPIYPGTCRGRTAPPDADVAWRLDIARAVDLAGPLSWIDELAGPQRAWPDMFGDVVLLRRDAPASYHLSATLDDAADGITHVTRGSDRILASHVHRLLHALLGLTVPVCDHHGRLVGADGRNPPNRRNSASLASLRLNGGDGLALAEALRTENFPAGISLVRRVEQGA